MTISTAAYIDEILTVFNGCASHGFGRTVVVIDQVQVESVRRRTEQLREDIEAQVSIEKREEIYQRVKHGDMESELGKVLG